jgi:hypothetical protein
LYGLFLQRIATKKHPMIRPIAVIAGLNLLLNLIWSPLVFVYKRRVAGLYIIYALIATLLALLVMLDDKSSKLLLLPYLTWLVVASQLQLASLIQNNQDTVNACVRQTLSIDRTTNACGLDAHTSTLHIGQGARP